MKEYIIKLKKTEKGGWRASVLTSRSHAKEKETFASTPQEALRQLGELLYNPQPNK